MNLIKKNLLANAVTCAYVPLVVLACTPVYIRLMGMESFGLVGVFTLLYTVLAPLSVGLSMAMNRQLAHLSIQENPAREMRNLLRTLEVVYWLTAFALGVLIAAAAPLISHYWIKAEQLPADVVSRVILLMGVTLTLQWPYSLYSGGLNGLQRQALLSVINVAMITVRFIGVLPVLWLVSPTVDVFFVWNAAASAVHTAAVGAALWMCLPRADGRAAFSFASLGTIWRFASGATGISIVAVVLGQQDKAILSNLLTLEMFGYYTLASMAATGLYAVVGPVFNALSPRFVQLASLNDRQELRRLYHLGCQLTAVPLLGLAAVGVLFSREILVVWTGDPVTAGNTWLVMSFLVAGTAMNGLGGVPYAVQLAYGWTSLALYINVAAIVVLAPLIILLVGWYGALGAALAWTIINGGCLLVSVHLTHGESREWYVQDLLLPLAAAVGATAVVRLVLPLGISRPLMALCLAAVGLVSVGAAMLAAPSVRRTLLLYLRRRTAARDTAG
jgi:O-antigen/teichoic acid export membrane protein